MSESSPETSPYRGGIPSAPAAPAQREGLVEELIKQFADPLAFYRELVQNSIDAGASAIGITLAWEPDPGEEGSGVVFVSVRDDGCGMGRDVLENQLTVLFRSTKDKDDTKIGKFGVGFVSVLALDPTLVAVQTSEGRGEEWTLHLARDQSYELFRASGGAKSGTTVTLHIPLRRGALDAFVQGSERALETWCRHVEVPVRLVAHLAGTSEMLHEARIDKPFGLDAVISIDARSGDGKARAAVGLPHDGAPYLAFFNRGLLLHETRQDVFGVVAVKVLDPRLEHTLSRDNVRRDEHYERAMRWVRGLIEDDLGAEAVRVLREISDGKRREPHFDVVLGAALRAGLSIDAREVRVPLLHPVRGERSLPLARLSGDGVYFAAKESAITRALAQAGSFVLDLGAAAAPDVCRELLASYAGRAIEEADAAVTLVESTEMSGSDLVLLDRTAALLGALARKPSSPRFVALSGVLSSALYVCGSGEPPRVLTTDAARRDPFAILARPALWISAPHPIALAARRAAPSRPDFAASFLARAILIAHGSLDADKDDEWLGLAIDRVS